MAGSSVRFRAVTEACRGRVCLATSTPPNRQRPWLHPTCKIDCRITEDPAPPPPPPPPPSYLPHLHPFYQEKNQRVLSAECRSWVRTQGWIDIPTRDWCAVPQNDSERSPWLFAWLYCTQACGRHGQGVSVSESIDSQRKRPASNQCTRKLVNVLFFFFFFFWRLM